jgi:hypothetical protein
MLEVLIVNITYQNKRKDTAGTNNSCVVPRTWTVEVKATYLKDPLHYYDYTEYDTNMDHWWKTTEALKYLEKNMSPVHESHTDWFGVAPRPP